MFMTTNVSPLDLHLDENNPRFRININPSQNDIRKYMIEHEKLLVLANSMTNMNTLLPGERVIIFNDGEKNIVLEGNRRTCVYQMLLDRSLIPSKIQPSFPVATGEFLSEISNIPVDVVNNRQEAMAFLAARHIVGVKKWSSVSKWKISYEYFETVIPFTKLQPGLLCRPTQCVPAFVTIKSYCVALILLVGQQKKKYI